MADVASLQQPDGSFFGDQWGEVDTRFSYCAVNCLSLLNRLDAVDVEKTIEFVLRCKNFDEGFGCVPGAESHAGQVFCCVATLAICNALDRVDADKLGWWLCERQVASGGLNGRPEKDEDVCYSWWVLSALAILGRLHWIDQQKLQQFILSCQVRWLVLCWHAEFFTPSVGYGARRHLGPAERHGRCVPHVLWPGGPGADGLSADGAHRPRVCALLRHSKADGPSRAVASRGRVCRCPINRPVR